MAVRDTGDSEVPVLLPQQFASGGGRRPIANKVQMLSCPEPVPSMCGPRPHPHGDRAHLGCQLGAVLQRSVQDLHVVGVTGVGELVEDHELDGGAQVVLMRIQQLPGHGAGTWAGAQHEPGCRLPLRPTSAAHLTQSM